MGADPNEIATLRHALAEQQRVGDQLRETIATQDQQFRTLTHRLKNNLQLVISILSLRLSAVRDETARRELEDVLSKIHAVALVQKKLHDSGRALAVRFDEYLRELIGNLHRGQNGHALTIETEPVAVGIERAVPLGLVANELIAASCHAAAHAPVALRLTRDAGKAVLVIEGDVTLPTVPGGPDFGPQLIEALTRQAQATLVFGAASGPAVRLSFEVADE